MSRWKAFARWESDRLKQPFGLARWGHYGVPVAFPTAGGDAEEIEWNHLLDHLAPFIEEGRIKVYSCDSTAGRAMTARDLDRLRDRFVFLASGSGDWEDVGESWRAAKIFGAEGVPNRVDDWGPDFDHDWPTWWQMLPTYVQQTLWITGDSRRCRSARSRRRLRLGSGGGR